MTQRLSKVSKLISFWSSDAHTLCELHGLWPSGTRRGINYTVSNTGSQNVQNQCLEIPSAIICQVSDPGHQNGQNKVSKAHSGPIRGQATIILKMNLLISIQAIPAPRPPNVQHTRSEAHSGRTVNDKTARRRCQPPPRPTARRTLSAEGAIGELARHALRTSQQEHGCSL